MTGKVRAVNGRAQIDDLAEYLRAWKAGEMWDETPEDAADRIRNEFGYRKTNQDKAAFVDHNGVAWTLVGRAGRGKHKPASTGNGPESCAVDGCGEEWRFSGRTGEWYSVPNLMEMR